ncbi:hypothetical protein ACTFBY_22285 [Aeromonas dhakensis]
MSRPIPSLLLLALLPAAGWAGDIHVPLAPYHFTAQQLAAGQPSALPLDEAHFVFGEAVMAFDLHDFLLQQAPHLLPKEEVILHWSGITSLNPQLLLALMETSSQLISAPSEQAMAAPFAKLVKARGFDNQLELMARQLSERFYQAAPSCSSPFTPLPKRIPTASVTRPMTITVALNNTKPHA